MKRHLFLLAIACLIIPSHAFAMPQKDTVVNVNSIPANDYMLDNGWKYVTEDNPIFALLIYDSNWINIDPTQKLPAQ